MTTIRIGDRVRLPYLGGVEGKLAEIPAVPPGVVVVGLDGGGAWHGMGNMLEKIVPPDLRHPAVIAVRSDDPESAYSLADLAFPDMRAARYLIAGFRWAEEHALSDPEIGRYSADAMALSRFVADLSDEIEATITPELKYHFGPTETDSEPGKRWHYDCGGEVDFIDGAPICGKCPQQGPRGQA